MFRKVVVGLLLGCAVCAAPTRAQTEAQFQALGKTLTTMGFEPKVDKSYVSFTSAQRYFHGFASCGDGRMNSYVPLVPFPTGHAPSSALMQALGYSNTHATYFSLNTDATSKTQNFVLNICYDPDETEAAFLQGIIGGLEGAANNTRDIWDPQRWK